MQYSCFEVYFSYLFIYVNHELRMYFHLLFMGIYEENWEVFCHYYQFSCCAQHYFIFFISEYAVEGQEWKRVHEHFLLCTFLYSEGKMKGR